MLDNHGVHSAVPPETVGLEPVVDLAQPSQGLLHLVFQNGPDNLITPPLLAALDRALATALAMPDQHVLLISAAGSHFSKGADAAARDMRDLAPSLRDICNRIEEAPFPVIVQLHGAVLGPAFELALAAHFRISHADAWLGLPDITLGLPPEAGATQRLPRLTDPETALDLLLSGRSVPASCAGALGLVDAIVAQDLDAGALDFAQSLQDEAPRATGRRPLPAFDCLHKAVARRRVTLPADGPAMAQRRILDCIESAALLPPEAAMAFEAAAFEDCVQSAMFRALHHADRTELRWRAAATARCSTAGMPQSVALWGWGDSAARLAARSLTAGAQVTLMAPGEAELASGVGRVDAALSAQAGHPSRFDACWAHLSGGIGLQALAGCDLVIEAAPGAWSAREAALPALAQALGPRATLAVTGVQAEPDKLAQIITGHCTPLWLNWPDTGPACTLAEIVLPRGTATAQAVALATLLDAMGLAVLEAVSESPALTLLAALLEAADALVELGAAPHAIDAAMRDWGFAAGPYELADRVGLASLLALRSRRADGDDPKKAPILLLGMLVAEGRTGRAAKRGYYIHARDGESAKPDPEVTHMAAEARALLGLAPRSVTADMIRGELAAAMIQAAAGLLRRGAVQMAGDIDLAAILGLGLARWRGGPMQTGDETGVLSVRRCLRGMAARNRGGAIWQPDPLIAELIASGGRLADLSAPDAALSPA